MKQATLICLATFWLAPVHAQEKKEGPVQTEMKSEKAGLSYLLYVPANYKELKKPVPLMLFLHGAGERGGDLKKVKKHGPPKLVEKGKPFPFIVVSPQCPTGKRWESKPLVQILNEVQEKYEVDSKRIYLTGLSMGGYGTWRLASDHPELFAAIAPICGGGDPKWAPKLKNTPIWVFHGAKDRAVPLKRSQDMVDALKKIEHDVKFTIYPEAGHDSWTVSYNNPKLYEWFLSHKLDK